MKNTTFLITILFTTLLLGGCSNETKKERNSEFLPVMEIEITDAIKTDADLVELVKSSEKSINEFSDNIEQLILDSKEYLNEDFNMEEASMMDKVKVGKTMVEFMSNSTEIMSTLQKFNSYVKEKEKQGIINDQQLKALEQVGNSFQKRMQDIETKYKHIINK